MFCCCFNDFCQTNCLNIYRSDLHQICRLGRNIAVDERSEVSFWSLKGRCRRNQFCGPNPGPIHTPGFAWHSLGRRTTRKKCNCCAWRRKTNELIRWTQANQLTGQLTITNRRLGRWPGGLQSGLLLNAGRSQRSFTEIFLYSYKQLLPMPLHCVFSEV